jgi:acetate kinase
MKVLVVNAGSSSVKLRVVDDGDQLLASRDLGPPDDGLAEQLGDFVHDAGAIDVVGHRVVHGGSSLHQRGAGRCRRPRGTRRPQRTGPAAQSAALAGIDAAARLLVGVPQVACFDTAFHASLPPAATTYAIPRIGSLAGGSGAMGFTASAVPGLLDGRRSCWVGQSIGFDW